jgi:hypothetical protein
MPSHARRLNVYRSGTLASKICDNEHTTASLGDSEELCVDKPPRNVQRPDFSKRVQDCEEVVAFIAAEGTCDVFPDGESGKSSSCCISHLLDDSDGFMEQAGSFSGESCPFAGDGEVLAG